MRDDSAIWHPSPNFTARRGGAVPDLIVLHYTAMASAEDALARLCSPDHEVSAHFLIGSCGTLWQMVAEDQRSWHAGTGAWGSVRDVNSRSIGIELDNDGRAPFSEPLMRRLDLLLARLVSDWVIPPERVIAHSDMAPTRKADPGAKFDWLRLAKQGLAVWPGVIAGGLLVTDDEFATEARTFGYPDAPFPVLLEAVRRRFRPQAHGPLETPDLALIRDLARRYPVDAPAGCA